MYLGSGNGDSKVLLVLDEKLLSPSKIQLMARRVGELDRTVYFRKRGMLSFFLMWFGRGRSRGSWLWSRLKPVCGR